MVAFVVLSVAMSVIAQHVWPATDAPGVADQPLSTSVPEAQLAVAHVYTGVPVGHPLVGAVAAHL
jgi:hypothetical protein